MRKLAGFQKQKAQLAIALLSMLIGFLAACNPIQQPPFPAPRPTEAVLPSRTPTQVPLPAITDAPTTTPSNEALTTKLPSPTLEDTPAPQHVRFAVIGDYGSGREAEADVADLIKSWEPDFIITTGDNNYPDGDEMTIDQNVGQFFHEFIASYQGAYGEGALENRFFPTLGNHDWRASGGEPYLDYFTLPGNERYYDFVWGPAHFFALDSDSREPDGVGRSSLQADWLQSKLAASSSPWKIVYFHHPPYSSGFHGSVDWMQWPFAEWGADIVFSGHDHTYERISRDGIQYFVNGLGGMSKYEFLFMTEGSQVRYNQDYGAMLVEAGEDMVLLKFINRREEVIDSYQLIRE